MNLDHITTRRELKEYVENFTDCPLARQGCRTVFSGGNPDADVMLIGEAPGAEEDIVGEPFVGRSGQLLLKLFGDIGLPREEVYITNMTFWRPPENRTPTKAELATTYPILLKHIELIAPKVLVLVGGTAAQKILDTKVGITKIHGEWQVVALPNGVEVKTMAVYHPAYLLRNNKKTPDMEADLGKIKTYLAEN